MHGARPAGRALERVVVDDDHRAVARDLHVELDHVGTELCRPAEGGEGVLGRGPARTSMRDHEGPHGTSSLLG